MALEIEWSSEAIEDLESIALYIEKDSPIYAKAVVSRCFEKVEILKEFPELGRVVPELSSKIIREIFIYSYRIIYKLEPSSILIIAVIHGKRVIGD